METFAPVVRIKRSGRYVFLLVWERDKHGTWRANVAWLAREQVAWHVVGAWMRADDLEPVQGQNYRHVPKHIEEPDF